MSDAPGEDQAAKDVSQIVGQHEEPEPDLIGNELRAGESSPMQCVLPFFDPLFSGTTSVIEMHDPFRLRAQVGHNESDPGEQLALMPLHFGHHPSGTIPTGRLIGKIVEPDDRFPGRTTDGAGQ